MDLEYYKNRILERKQKISENLASQADSTKPVELDQAAIGRVSRVDAIQQQAMAIAVNKRMQIELQRIEAALRRMENGDYGICTVCEEAIPEKRLKLDPALLTCVECSS